MSASAGWSRQCPACGAEQVTRTWVRWPDGPGPAEVAQTCTGHAMGDGMHGRPDYGWREVRLGWPGYGWRPARAGRKGDEGEA